MVLALLIALSATEQYLDALKRETGVERLFELATAAAAEVERTIVDRDEGRAGAPVPARIDGLIISSEEALYARPDPRFFAELAGKRGRAVDQRFFQLLVRTRPDGIWPVYVEQQTDVTGCTRFDSPELVPLYRGWLDFEQKYSGAYRERAVSEREEIERLLRESDCACGSRASTAAGLTRFVRAFPRAPGLKKRLEKIRAGKSELRFRCASG